MQASASAGRSKRKLVIDSDEDGVDYALHHDITRPAEIEWPHNRIAHTLDGTSAQSIRGQLTAWFNDVHDARGMPWRRRWDPSLDRDAKAQRAYEVRALDRGVFFSLTPQFDRFGLARSCASRLGSRL